MMRFLKSILLPSKKSQSEIALQKDLSTAVNRIDDLENRLEKANELMEEMSKCLKEVAYATQHLSTEVLSITTILQQAADHIQKENEVVSLSSNKDDEDYLN